MFALEDAKLTNQDIYLIYLDFKNAFESINHARLLTIMTNLEYPHDVINLVDNIYSQYIFSYIVFNLIITKIKIKFGLYIKLKLA